jgi:pimeloyl-ACP methyl ester carboxylesterase
MAQLRFGTAEDHRPLVNPTAYGGKASDAFDVVIPSMPGYGFSKKLASTGWGPERMARAWHELMQRLGYKRYVAQGGDRGAFVVDQMGLQKPKGVLAVHTNMPATVPADVDKALLVGAPAPPGLSSEENRAYQQLVRTFKQVSGSNRFAGESCVVPGFAELLGEEHGLLLPCGEVAAFCHLVVVDQVRICLLRPTARCFILLARENADGNRDRHAFGVEETAFVASHNSSPIIREFAHRGELNALRRILYRLFFGPIAFRRCADAFPPAVRQEY